MTALLNVLFLCTGNTARSIMAECYLNHVGGTKFRAYSAGSHPKGAVHPLSLETLRSADIDVATARSKSWDEFAGPDAPKMDLVITVCDNAAGEVCPIWPGAPAKAHWSFEDPAAIDGTLAEQRAGFARVFAQIKDAIDRLVSLPIDGLDPQSQARRVSELGPVRPAA
ncbi:MAG: arsenate reductase ArsC [Alphaproteobacteria bacterium]|nr:arsenate reductase ArsC [Alphaproteobacteria bacterium]